MQNIQELIECIENSLNIERDMESIKKIGKQIENIDNRPGCTESHSNEPSREDHESTIEKDQERTIEKYLRKYGHL